MTAPNVSRREFLQAGVATLVLGPATLTAASTSGSVRSTAPSDRAASAMAVDELRVYWLLPDSATDLARGVLLGIEEAHRTASLMSRGVVPVRASDEADLARQLNHSAVEGIIAHDADAVLALAPVAARRAVPLLNVGVADEPLRAQLCDVPVFHVTPSDAMLDRARRAAPAGAGAAAVAWHPSLFRYGAEQLNDRYRARFAGAEMTDAAWCGWMAVKILGDAALRSRARTSSELAAWLSSPRARFDGHKGVPLRFDGRRQLQQPVYAVNGDRVISEVGPAERGPVGEATSCA